MIHKDDLQYFRKIRKQPTEISALDLEQDDVEGFVEDYSDLLIQNGTIITLSDKGRKELKKSTIDQLCNNEIKISPSAFKMFIEHGPRGLVNYYTEPKEAQTDDQRKGEGFEQFLLEPDKFKKNFAVFDDSSRPNPDKDFRDGENKKYKDNFERVSNGKKLISQDLYNSFEKVRDAIYNTNDFQYLMEFATFQQTLTRKHYDLTFLGILDIYLKGEKIVDLKKCQSAKFSKVRWNANSDYMLQACSYYWLSYERCEFSFYFFDMKGYVIEVGISPQRIKKEKDEFLGNLEKYIALTRLGQSNQWNKGVEFLTGGKYFIW